MWRALPVLVSTVMAICLAAGAARAASTEYGRYHALIIGNNAYKHLKPLQTAVADATAVAEILRLKYGFEVKLLINATRQQILRALNRYRADLTGEDNLLIYYAGHGILDRESKTGFWQPVDAEEDDDINWIANEDLTRRFVAMNARHIMVVADSCYSGSLVRSSSAILPAGGKRGPWLRRLATKFSRTAMVSGGLEPVEDAGANGHSVFANAFLRKLRQNREILDGQSLAKSVSQDVVRKVDQTPQYSDIRKAGHEGGDFLLVPKYLMASKTSAAKDNGKGKSKVDARTMELEYWLSISDSGDAAAFNAYLKQFPNGTFAGLARVKLANLSSAKKSRPRRRARNTRPAASDRDEPLRDFSGKWVAEMINSDGACSIAEVGSFAVADTAISADILLYDGLPLLIYWGKIRDSGAFRGSSDHEYGSIDFKGRFTDDGGRLTMEHSGETDCSATWILTQR